MDTEQRYLRDIRDAIKGVEKRSAMQTNGNEKAKYLKDIADAIRENGGGGKDGNDIFLIRVKKHTSGSEDKGSGTMFRTLYNLTDGTASEGAAFGVYFNKSFTDIFKVVSNPDNNKAAILYYKPYNLLFTKINVDSNHLTFISGVQDVNIGNDNKLYASVYNIIMNKPN